MRSPYNESSTELRHYPYCIEPTGDMISDTLFNLNPINCLKFIFIFYLTNQVGE